ncbi:MAG: DUF697 domain-containing protein [Deltaproteobacteria bacterium]|nr:DUF697 domain-containing protein [Deltaproteobacteria bacterium]
MNGSENKPSNAPSAASPVDEMIITDEMRLAADNIIKKYVILAMGAGLIPSALVDVVAVTVLEVKMIGDLAGAYRIPIPHRLVRYKVLISLIASLGSVYLSIRMHTALKDAPVVGYLFSAGMLSITGGAAVYAVGKIFQKHYESGGTFLSSDNSVLRRYFKEKYQEGKKVVPGYATP